MRKNVILLLMIVPSLVFGMDCNLIDASSDPVALKCKLGKESKKVFMKKSNLLKMYWDTKALNIPLKISDYSPLYKTPKLLKMINGCLYTSEIKTILPKGEERKICATSVKCQENGKKSIKIATCLQRKGSCPEPYDCLTDNSVSVSDATFVEKTRIKPSSSNKGSKN